MQQIATLWNALETRKRVMVVLATLAMFAAVLGLARLANAPTMSLLYAGLESGPAGDVVRALEQRGVVYEVRGGTIFVENARRDELRMTLASEGLPSNSAQGYELLDGLSGFGTTSQMFDAAYWRAKEGELARTILASPEIAAARVHIAHNGSNPFQRDIRPTASVMVTPASGAIDSRQAQALRFLVASAVAGLTPEDVSVIDSSGGLVGASEQAADSGADDRADAMRARVQRLLEARVGSGNAVVELSVDTVNTTELIRETRIDPESRVAISTDTEERTNTASDQGGGDVTVASNLPDGDAAGGDGSSSQSSESRERVNYEVSQTEREITQSPGAIRRLSVAVLVNGTMEQAADGSESFVPRSDTEIAALRELVASAVGFDEARGDVITLKSMQFEPAPMLGTAAEPSFWAGLGLDLMSLVQSAVLALVALVLGLFVIRPVIAGSQRSPAPLLAGPESEGSAETPNTTPALTGEIDDGEMDPESMSVVSEPDADRSDGASLALRHRGEDPVARLRNMIGERQEETVEILRSWLEGEEENA